MRAIKYLVLVCTTLLASLTIGFSTEQDKAFGNTHDSVHLDNNRIFNTIMDFTAGQDMNYADDDILNILRTAYDRIDFYGEFEAGDIQKYDYYLEKFKALVNNQVEFRVKDSAETYYLQEYEGLSSDTPEKYAYLFFDMDADGAPELCIRGVGFTYVFQYEPQSHQFVLWKNMGSANYSIIGSQKITWEWFGTRSVYAFYQLDQDGNEEYTVTFAVIRPNENFIYMASLPEHEAVTEEVKTQGYYASMEGCYYFRITEEQFQELSNVYFKATDWLRADEKASQVTYTYEELWGSD